MEERTAQPQPDPRGRGCDADGQCRRAQAHPQERRSEESRQAHRHQDRRGQDGDPAEDHRRRTGGSAADPAAEEETPAKKAAAKKTTAKKATAKKTTAKKTAAKKTTGKKDDAELVDEEVIEETKAADEPEGTENAGFVLSDEDEDDAPAQQVAAAGATADPVKDYLKQIGKVPLLNAEQEVELAKRIEAGLFAEDKLANSDKLAPKLKRELEIIAEDGRRAKNHLLEANLRLVVSWPSATPAAACSSWTSSRRATSV